MEHRENESRGAQEAPSRAMVVEAAAAPVGRRDIAALVGALAGLAATGCASPVEGDDREALGSQVAALTGTTLAWVDTVLGAVPTQPTEGSTLSSPRGGDLATKNSANIGNARIVIAKGCVTAGDGGGGVFYWDNSSTTPDDGGTTIIPSSGGGRWRRIFSGAMILTWFGAKRDETNPPTTTDNWAAVKMGLSAAIAAGRPLSGQNQTYGVNGEVALLANAQLQDITLKQLAPGGSDRRTLRSDGSSNIKLVRVKVNRAGDGWQGHLESAAGIWIQGGSGHHFEDVEVWGNDKGSGFVVCYARSFNVVRLHVHDIRYAQANPEDDLVQGFWFNACNDFRVIAPKVHDLGGVGTTARSRNPFGGCSNFSLIDAQVWNVDQGIDFTGSEGNTNFRVLGGSVRDCHSVGFKFANSAHGGVVVGATAERCDLYGFFASGPTNENGPLNTGNITFVDCLALDTGNVGNWKNDPNNPKDPDDPNGVYWFRPAGFAVETNERDPTISPLGIRFVNCTALDRQPPTESNPLGRTMKYGFANQVAAPDPINPETIPYLGRYNECIDCVSIGHLASPTKNMHRAFCQVKLTAPQPLTTSGAWIPVNWNDADHDEGAMHTDGEGKYIYARQPGLYRVSTSLEFAFNTTGGRGLRLLKNDDEIPGTVLRRPPSTNGGDETRISLTWQVLCAAGDKLSVDAFQQSGDRLELTTSSRMSVTKIHDTGPEA